MPKPINKIQNKKRIQRGTIDTLEFSDDINTKTIVNIPNDTERKVICGNHNKFIYLTPISNEKINCYFPSTPKKLKGNKEDESSVKGKNLLFIFESM